MVQKSVDTFAANESAVVHWNWPSVEDVPSLAEVFSTFFDGQEAMPAMT